MTQGAVPWHPPRLLDCGFSEDPHETHLDCRLIETGGRTLDGPYMTLSHCWGTVDCLRLTTSNRNRLLNTIAFSSLPQLYQDAVYVVRRLGVRYLWIDSICIIQEGDGLADWRRQVSLMGDVYSNSFCNISASEATDGHHTMFNSREPHLLLPEVVRYGSDSFLVSDKNLWHTEVSAALLNTRAWVLQERLLSPRILHFGAHQLFWECHHKDAAEFCADDILPSLTRSDAVRFKRLIPKQGAEGDGEIKAYRAWAAIVRAYTACNLTFPSDKLPALSSVAKAMRRMLRDEYVAGLWRRFLEYELLWSTVSNIIHPPRNIGTTTDQRDSKEMYRCPSWSWASVDVQVNPGLIDVESSEILIEVLATHLEYATEDNTSSIRSGWLQLRGVLKRLSLVPYHSPGGLHNGAGNWDMYVNGVHVSETTEFVLREQQPHVKLDAFHEDFSKQNSEAALYCMPGRIRQGDNGSIYFLLFELLDRGSGIFRRIGLARGWGKAVKAKIMARNDDEAAFPCEEYQNGLHSIRVI